MFHVKRWRRAASVSIYANWTFLWLEETPLRVTTCHVRACAKVIVPLLVSIYISKGKQKKHIQWEKYNGSFLIRRTRNHPVGGRELLFLERKERKQSQNKLIIVLSELNRIKQKQKYLCICMWAFNVFRLPV